MGKQRLTAIQKKCIELLVMKDVEKKTNNQIAQECGIDRATLYRWKNKPEFNDALIQRAEEFNRSFLPDTYGTLRTIMMYGTDAHRLKAIELMLKNQGRLKEVQEQNTNISADIDTQELFKELGIK